MSVANPGKSPLIGRVIWLGIVYAAAQALPFLGDAISFVASLVLVPGALPAAPHRWD